MVLPVFQHRSYYHFHHIGFFDIFNCSILTYNPPPTAQLTILSFLTQQLILLTIHLPHNLNL